MTTLASPKHTRTRTSRLGLWLVGTGLYGVLLSATCLVLVVTR